MATATVFSIFGFMLLAVLIVAPLIVGILLIVKSRGRGAKFPSCGSCGYDLSATVGTAARCPECGNDFVAVGILPPGGRRSPAMLWSGILILLIPFTCVGFGGVLSMMSTQRMATARQAAVAAQAQATAVRQAQANALFPIPAPLNDDQICQLSIEQASAAMGKVSAALNRTDLTPEDRARLQHELELLAQQSPLTDEQINAMTLQQAQAALMKVSVARKNAATNPQDKDRLRGEFEKLLNQIGKLKGNGLLTLQPPPPAASPASSNVSPPLTDDQIDQMSLPEAQAALTRVSVARRQASATPEEKTRLKAEFERLLKRIMVLKSGS